MLNYEITNGREEISKCLDLVIMYAGIIIEKYSELPQSEIDFLMGDVFDIIDDFERAIVHLMMIFDDDEGFEEVDTENQKEYLQLQSILDSIEVLTEGQDTFSPHNVSEDYINKCIETFEKFEKDLIDLNIQKYPNAI